MLSSPFAALLVLRLSCLTFAAPVPAPRTMLAVQGDASYTQQTEVQYSSAPPQFPGSRIVSNANWAALWDPPLHPAGCPPLPGSNKTKSLNGWAEKPEAQVWALCYSSFTDNHDNPDVFHKQCDKHTTTMVVVKNALNFSFGGYVRIISPSSFLSHIPPALVSSLSCSSLKAIRFLTMSAASWNAGGWVMGSRTMLREQRELVRFCILASSQQNSMHRPHSSILGMWLHRPHFRFGLPLPAIGPGRPCTQVSGRGTRFPDRVCMLELRRHSWPEFQGWISERLWINFRTPLSSWISH